jgi:hypothetical protein
MAYLRQDGIYHFKNYASQHCYYFQENGLVCGFGLGQLKLDDIRNRLRSQDYVCGQYALDEDRIRIEFEGGPRIQGRIDNNRLLLQIRWDDSNDNIESREYDFFVVPPDPAQVEADAEKARLARATLEMPALSSKTGLLSEPKTKAAESQEMPASPRNTRPLGESRSAQNVSSKDDKDDQKSTQ